MDYGVGWGSKGRILDPRPTPEKVTKFPFVVMILIPGEVKKPGVPISGSKSAFSQEWYSTSREPCIHIWDKIQ